MWVDKPYVGAGWIHVSRRMKEEPYEESSWVEGSTCGVRGADGCGGLRPDEGMGA